MIIPRSNAWSCLPASFSMALGISLEEMIRYIGHDGSKHVFENSKYPLGFHIQECIDVADTLGYSCTPIDFRFASTPSPVSSEIYEYTHGPARIMQYLNRTARGVIEARLVRLNGTQIGHAVAWIDQKIYDPQGKGFIYELDMHPGYGLLPLRLWRLQKND